jgi:predicted secreted Zn-dependent protease
MDGKEAYVMLVSQMEAVHKLMTANLELVVNPELPEYVRQQAKDRQAELSALFNQIHATLKRHEADLIAQGFTFGD